VNNVSWEDAKIYLAWLSKRTGKTYRLLTEAEWEYAARAQTTQRFFFGDDDASVPEYAWFVGNSELKTHVVGQKKPNGFGLFDMYGNVWEWCEDCYKSYYGGAPSDGSPVLFAECSRRVMRGGSYSHVPYGVRSAQRNKAPYSRYKGLGFRVARTLETAER
jgi:formylglycine-generating enzyme required for sulfatase activity